MELKLTTTDLKELLSEYYYKRDQIDSKVVFNTTLERDMYNEEIERTEVKLKRKINLLGKDRVVDTVITENELKDTLKIILEEAGYILDNLTFDSGINYVTEGYGFGEQTIARPYFKGAIINIRKLDKVKKL